MKYNYKQDGFYYPIVLFSLEQAKTYRGQAARANHLAQDIPDIQFAAK